MAIIPKFPARTIGRRLHYPKNRSQENQNMDQSLQDSIGSIVSKETWSAEDHQELLARMSGVRDAAGKFRGIVSEIEASTPDPKGGAALKVGICRYMTCRFAAALDILGAATDNKDRRYFQAQCLKQLRQFDKAAEEMQRAKDRGWDERDADLELAELQALRGDVEGASKAVAKLASKCQGDPKFFYVRGLVEELSGNGDAAVDAYTQARKLKQAYTPATFRLAYYHDLHGEEQQAIDLYKECLSSPPVHASALLNLAVLYEDAGKYDKATNCLMRLLACHPGHARAKLFLKDVEASKTMFYDEDQARRIAKRNAVLDIPVTDFELSVRARNCLKKMNIHTLGDLVKTTEAELLGYKNFGETSLKEIKDMLTARGLRLGQALEEPSLFQADRPAVTMAPARNEGVLATPIEQVEFSVRARRALETLGIRSLGDLAGKSEAELLACKNFGQTSLNEVRQRLSEYGMTFREPN